MLPRLTSFILSVLNICTVGCAVFVVVTVTAWCCTALLDVKLLRVEATDVTEEAELETATGVLLTGGCCFFRSVSYFIVLIINLFFTV